MTPQTPTRAAEWDLISAEGRRQLADGPEPVALLAAEMAAAADPGPVPPGTELDVRATIPVNPDALLEIARRPDLRGAYVAWDAFAQLDAHLSRGGRLPAGWDSATGGAP